MSTLNRAAFIGETLDSILGQLTEECEVVVLDASSDHDTERVVEQRRAADSRLRYIRQGHNKGFDRDIDTAVESASGEYCWLMSDDDIMMPGAVTAVLKALQRNPSLVVVNAGVFNPDTAEIICERLLNKKKDRVHGAGEMDVLFEEVGLYMRYLGCVVLKREIWLGRDKKSYYGSLFVHVGVIFQKPLPAETLVLAEPLISIRYGGVRWRGRNFEILGFKWPDLVWSLPLSKAARRTASVPDPWKNLPFLSLCRSLDEYSIGEYRQWVRPIATSVWRKTIPALTARIPGVLANTIWLLYFMLSSDPYRGWYLVSLRASRFHFRNWRAL